MSKMPNWAVKLAPEGPERTLRLRKQVRYWCFRLRTEIEDGVSSKGKPAGLKAYFEKMPHFDGWENFGATWDVEDDDPLKTKPRYRTIHEEWDDTLAQHIRKDEIETRKAIRKRNGSEGQL